MLILLGDYANGTKAWFCSECRQSFEVRKVNEDGDLEAGDPTFCPCCGRAGGRQY
jgi:rubrerythrin